MFPNVNGFHFSAGHLIFLGIFFAVVGIVAATVILATLKSWRALRDGQHEKLRWRSEFHDLPASHRACRHEISGGVAQRKCERGFDCRACEFHASRPAAAPAQADMISGLEYPAGRLYHRGHTWVQQEADGTVTIGLDDLGKRLAGVPDEVALPAKGSRLTLNGTGWRMKNRGIEARILSPIDGEVVEANPLPNGWHLRVKPASDDFRHLLRGAEVAPWVMRELDRLQMAAPRLGLGPALADGGVVVEDIPAACPELDLDRAYGAVFLEP